MKCGSAGGDAAVLNVDYRRLMRRLLRGKLRDCGGDCREDDAEQRLGQWGGLGKYIGLSAYISESNYKVDFRIRQVIASQRGL